jgi:hypothetical protein
MKDEYRDRRRNPGKDQEPEVKRLMQSGEPVKGTAEDARNSVCQNGRQTR